MIQTAETIIGKRPIFQVSPECRFLKFNGQLLKGIMGKVSVLLLAPSYTKLFQTHTLYQGGYLPPPPPPHTHTHTHYLINP